MTRLVQNLGQYFILLLVTVPFSSSFSPQVSPFVQKGRIVRNNNINKFKYCSPTRVADTQLGPQSFTQPASLVTLSMGESEEGGSDTSAAETQDDMPRWKKLKQKVFPPKPDDGLTFRQRLAKAGLSVVLSYGWVSNMSYVICISIAWYIFSVRNKVSPLAPGQWPKFLAVYAGFWVFNNFVRPLRFALSVAVSTYFDSLVSTVQNKFRCRRGVAVGLTVFIVNVVGTTSLMCAGIALASVLSGIPIWRT